MCRGEVSWNGWSGAVWGGGVSRWELCATAEAEAEAEAVVAVAGAVSGGGAVVEAEGRCGGEVAAPPTGALAITASDGAGPLPLLAFDAEAEAEAEVAAEAVGGLNMRCRCLLSACTGSA